MPIYNLNKPIDTLKPTLDKLNAIVGNEHLFISITADWCGHCRRMKPEWTKATTSMSKDGVHVVNISDEVFHALQKLQGSQPIVSLIQYFANRKADARFEGFPTVLHVKKYKRLSKNVIRNIDVPNRIAPEYKSAMSIILKSPPVQKN
jgi:thiol-disulfide isomerase/thioredoxin